MAVDKQRLIAWRSRPARWWALATVLVIAIVGCSSSPQGASPDAGSAASRTSSSGGASGSGGVALARSRVSKYGESPASALSSLPGLKSKPPAGKTIAFLFQPLPQGEAVAQGIKNAAAAVGWKYKQVLVNFSDPSTIVAGINQAVQQYHANVIASIDPTLSEIQSTFPTVNKSGAIIVPNFAIINPTGPIPAVIAGTGYFTLAGAMLADWVTVQSNGTGHILFAAIDAFPALAQVRKGFDDELASVCPACKSTVAQVTIEQAAGNQGNSVITSALQRDPSIKYVVTADGALFGGLTSALDAAGLGGKVTIASAAGDVQNQTAILNGQEGATTGDRKSVV